MALMKGSKPEDEGGRLARRGGQRGPSGLLLLDALAG